MRVVSVEEMREIERRAETEYGLTSPMLMERAGQSAAEILRAHAGGDVRDLAVLVLVGPGNNGGDGRVMGRYLAGWGARVSYFLWKENALERNGQVVPAGDALGNVREALASADIVADALLGTGHARPLAPTMRQALKLVQAERERRPGGLIVLAVDLPSGLNAERTSRGTVTRLLASMTSGFTPRANWMSSGTKSDSRETAANSEAAFARRGQIHERHTPNGCVVDKPSL